MPTGRREWKPLFYRILENRIRDMQRRRTVRGRIIAWLPSRGNEEEDDESDPIQQAPSTEPQPVGAWRSTRRWVRWRRPLGTAQRQQQAFLLRSLEGMDVAETATAMGCSQGSVKTHYFRAVQALRAQLGEFDL